MSQIYYKGAPYGGKDKKNVIYYKGEYYNGSTDQEDTDESRPDDEIGMQVNYRTGECIRLGAAEGLISGTDFDKFAMFGGRRRCTVDDSGNIIAWYGEENYIEDGSNGQVMVYQPAFYYKVVPIEKELQTEGIEEDGYHLRKAEYYVCSTKKEGYKLHPLFYDRNNNEIDYVFLSAYEGSIFDFSANEYLKDDEEKTLAINDDKFCSISGVKPASGKSIDLTKEAIEKLAQNRTQDWHCDLIKAESANQLLMIIEFNSMNIQNNIEQGVVDITTINKLNCSSLTGSTSNLGNNTGYAIETINRTGDIETVYNTDGKKSITYRGVENPWGNINKHINGIRFKEKFPYICKDFSFSSSNTSNNYENVNFKTSGSNNYISAMGYGSEEFDWLFLASEAIGGTDTSPVGDYVGLSGSPVVFFFGGNWAGGFKAGPFCWSSYFSGEADTTIGGRLTYVPTRKTSQNEVYIPNIKKWETKTGFKCLGFIQLI